ncbi:hypothetical protein C0989_002288 [Termitomyces sp. Mn162]|nr:hypothetical protein C0989_002288 [Termitomyces sp. Mn162]
MLHDWEQYGQGKQTLDEYINSFQALVKQATYSDGLQLCLMFQDSLHPMLVECIDNLAEGHSNDKRIASWYEVAWNQLMEIQWELCCMHPTLCSTLVTSLQYSAPAHPAPAPTLTTPVPHPLPPGISMNMDAAQQLHAMPLLCQRCKKPGHFALHCLLSLEVHYLSTVEQEELLLQLLAMKDAARAPLPDEPMLELTLKEISTCTSPPELEKDF